MSYVLGFLLLLWLGLFIFYVLQYEEDTRKVHPLLVSGPRVLCFAALSATLATGPVGILIVGGALLTGLWKPF